MPWQRVEVAARLFEVVVLTITCSPRVHRRRPDNKNALYQDSIKKGDALLNRIQKLSKIIDIE
jgi:hypothetical protein